MHQHQSTSKKPTGYRFIACSTALLLFLSNALYAREAIDLKTAVQRTLTSHPQLAVYPYYQQRALHEVEQASQGSPVVVNLQLEDAFGGGQRSGLSGLQSTLSLSWLLEQEQVQARIDLAKDQVGEQQNLKQLKRIDLAAQTASLFVNALAKQQQLKLTKLALQQSRQRLQHISRQLTAGNASQIDLLRAKADLSRRALAMDDQRHEVDVAAEQLKAQWNGIGDIAIQGELSAVPSTSQLKQALAQLQRHPQIDTFAHRRRVISAQVNLAKAEARSPWQVSTGLRRNELTEDFSLVAGVSFALAQPQRNRGKIRALHAEKQALDAQQQAWSKAMSTRLLVLTQQLEHSRHLIQKLNNEVIPLLQDASDQAQTAYQLGKYSYSEWFSVANELLNTNLQLIDAYANLHLNTIELERLSGVPLSL